jgi:hypothetical protein
MPLRIYPVWSYANSYKEILFSYWAIPVGTYDPCALLSEFLYGKFVFPIGISIESIYL